MFAKYMIIVKDSTSSNSSVCVYEFDDAEAAFVAYDGYCGVRDVVMYRRFKHDYISI